MEIARKKKGTAQSFAFRPRHVLLVCLFLSCVLLGILFIQRSTIREIEHEQSQLQLQRDALLLEEQRVEQMLSYVYTDEYLARYARDMFGYVLPGEYKFYYEEGDPSVE